MPILYTTAAIPMNKLRNTNASYLLSFVLFILLAWYVLNNSHKQGSPIVGAAEQAKDTTYKLTLLFAGDVMMHSPQLDAAYNPGDGQYYFENSFRFVKPIVSGYDVAIANLETTLPGENYTGYPMFGSPDNLAKALADAGFDILATSNNHAADKGAKGIQRTIDIVEYFGMQHTGSYKDTTNRLNENPLIFTRNNIRVALLNYTYGTNGMKVPPPYIINLIDTAAIRADLARAEYYKPDYTIVFFHWGIEYQRQPNAEQRAIAQFTFENGADLIIGGHPHVIQPIEEISYKRDGKKRTGVVYWSLGNYISNQRNQYQDGGIMATLQLTKDTKKGETTLADYGYIPAWVNKASRTVQKDYVIIPNTMWETDTSMFEVNKAELYKFKQFGSDTRAHLKDVKEEKIGIAWNHDSLRIPKPPIASYWVQFSHGTQDVEPQAVAKEYNLNADTLARLCQCTPAYIKKPQPKGGYAYYFTPLNTIENARKVARLFREHGADRVLLEVDFK